MEWEFCSRPAAGTAPVSDPALVADLVAMLLTGRPGPFPRLRRGCEQETITFKGMVGRELAARGLDVELAVYADEGAFDSFAEIVATAPGAGNSKFCVTDQGILTWVRDYRAGTGLGLGGQITGPAIVAACVVEAVTRAMAYLRPGHAGPEPHAASAEPANARRGMADD